MGAGHSHGHGEITHMPANARARRLLLSIVIPLFIASIVGAIMLWPQGDAAVKPGDRSALSPGSYYTDVLVTGVDASACTAANPDAAASSNPTADPALDPALDPAADPTATAPATDKNAQTIQQLSTPMPDCVVVTGQPSVADPDGNATVTVIVAPEFQQYGIHVGDTLRTMFSPIVDDPTLAADPTAPAPTQGTYAFVDFERGSMLWVLAIVYAILVIAVARLRGLAAIVGLVFAFVVIGYFVLPALLAGESALLVGVVSASLIMHIVLYTAHGFNMRTTTALIGTMAGVAITALLGMWSSSAGRISGLAGSEDSLTLQSLAQTVSIGDVVLCGIVLAGLGVLNDVTITQASAVWELRAARPDLTRRQLFVSGMRIGRDHIASTVYTIAFAYAGSALPVLLLVALFDNPLMHTLTTGEVAVELVRTLVGSIGLVLAIPATTALAVWAVRGRGDDNADESHDSAVGADASEAALARARERLHNRKAAAGVSVATGAASARPDTGADGAAVAEAAAETAAASEAAASAAPGTAPDTATSIPAVSDLAGDSRLETPREAPREGRTGRASRRERAPEPSPFDETDDI
ncbi:YibE/F family protein [Micrococcales bacterium 31B]|nr:YibE/F family protein [Micrococcales bacterium 31B]